MSEAQKLLERDLHGQTRVLKQLAKGASLDEVLHTLVDVAEESRPEMIASVLLVDEETGRLRNGASRRLPEAYCRAIDGTKPGPRMGSCGTAAFTGKRVIVNDINTDPLWEKARDIALSSSLQACWSEPIIGSSGNVLGTFAMYYRCPRSPEESELEFVSNCANLAALAIERVRYQNSVELERAMLKTIVNGVPDALVSSNLDREITHFSRSAVRMFGYQPEEVIGKRTTFLYATEEDHERLGEQRFNLDLDENLSIVEINWRRKSGEVFPGEMVAVAIRDDDEKAIGYLGLIRDITDRKIAEAKLQESQNRLVQAERLAAMGQMVSAIAHESRNALQRIQVGVDVLSYEIEEGSDAKEDLDRISRAKSDLERMHDELRSFAGSIKLNRSRTDLAEVWRQAWSNLAVARRDRDVKLNENVNEVNLECLIDDFRLEQVFRNLFENSLAACEDPVQIDVDAQVEVAAGNEGEGEIEFLTIRVSDNGPGLDEEIRERVFEAFQTTKAKGTGLGMAIAKRLVETHGGTIETNCDRPIGAEFIIRLPRS
ncbi:ATP-binding protein [Rhodopirellula sallentina]|uniref:histidine kinase n=1 Tax=Rhodopirellula sallentina SM41 TaxID=1263870 RepID=M5UGC6_9BACT|nr:ATP-binding protein [Rhodopirellula sallentina]EMI55063.1 multi-sensor hybrid histidine kinase [Rhodopirellula sallentina SM41]